LITTVFFSRHVANSFVGPLFLYICCFQNFTGAPWQTRNFQEQLQEIAVYQADEALDKAVVEAQIEDLESRLDSRQQQNQDVGTVGNGGAKA
jgi:hypothetical protein